MSMEIVSFKKAGIRRVVNMKSYLSGKAEMPERSVDHDRIVQVLSALQ